MHTGEPGRRHESTHPRVRRRVLGIHRIELGFAQVFDDARVAVPLGTGLAVEADCIALEQDIVEEFATGGRPCVPTPTCRTLSCNGGENGRAGCQGAAPRALHSFTSWCRRPRLWVTQKLEAVRARHGPWHLLRTRHRWRFGPTAALATSRIRQHRTTHLVAPHKFSDLCSGRAVRDFLPQAKLHSSFRSE